MYVEKRKFGKRIKYYLVYSYREEGKVKKIRKYLGIDLSNEELEIAKKKFGKEFLLVYVFNILNYFSIIYILAYTLFSY